MKTENKVREVELPHVSIKDISLVNNTNIPLSFAIDAPLEGPGTLRISIKRSSHTESRDETAYLLYALLVDLLPHSPETDPKFWAQGNLLLCKTEEAANTMADLLEAIGITDCATTGHFDPREDAAAGSEDQLTGYYYVDF